MSYPIVQDSWCYTAHQYYPHASPLNVSVSCFAIGAGHWNLLVMTVLGQYPIMSKDQALYQCQNSNGPVTQNGQNHPDSRNTLK